MAEEEKKNSQQVKRKSKEKKGLLILVFFSLILFVVFVGAFFYLLGVFNQQNQQMVVNANQEPMNSHSQIEEPQEQPLYAAIQNEFLPEIDSLNLAEMDSASQISWFEKEKKDLTEQRKALEVEKRELELLKLEVESLLTKKQSAQEEKLNMLVQLYDGMKAEEVASVMENLDDSTIVAVLPKMKAQHAAKVLGLLNPKRAAKISNQLMALK